MMRAYVCTSALSTMIAIAPWRHAEWSGNIAQGFRRTIKLPPLPNDWLRMRLRQIRQEIQTEGK